jgi:hypothetical protein
MQVPRPISAKPPVSTNPIEPNNQPTQGDAAHVQELPQHLIDEIQLLVEDHPETAHAFTLTNKQARKKFFSRITEVTLNPEDLKKGLALYPNLSKITISDRPYATQLECLRGNGEIKELWFQNARHMKDEHFEIFASLTGLERLSFAEPVRSEDAPLYRARTRNVLFLTNEGLEHLHGLKNLKELNLGDSQLITLKGLKSLLIALPGLTTVHTGQCITIGLDILRSPDEEKELRNNFGSRLPSLT